MCCHIYIRQLYGYVAKVILAFWKYNVKRGSSLKSIKNELLQFLEQETREIKVVVMPDFFLDRIIDLECDAISFASIIADIVSRKGGSIDGVAQTDLRGGNAINTASALANLGINVTPIICTSRLGLQQLRFSLKAQNIDLSHVKTIENASLTTALELKSESGKANVMLRDLGSLADFGPASLIDDDYELIAESDYVCLFNWAGTRKHGTELAKKVFQKMKTRGKGKTYFDTADPNPNRERIPELIDNVLKTELVDVLSLNENEAVTYASFISGGSEINRSGTNFNEFPLESARLLAKRLDVRIDLHARTFSGTFTKKIETVVPALKLKALRATGAGDAWNAGNILADGNRLSDECRLALANTVSACYLTDPTGEHPTKRKLVSFLKSHQFISGI